MPVLCALDAVCSVRGRDGAVRVGVTVFGHLRLSAGAGILPDQLLRCALQRHGVLPRRSHALLLLRCVIYSSHKIDNYCDDIMCTLHSAECVPNRLDSGAVLSDEHRLLDLHHAAAVQAVVIRRMVCVVVTLLLVPVPRRQKALLQQAR